jgi:hypothetical protein
VAAGRSSCGAAHQASVLAAEVEEPADAAKLLDAARPLDAARLEPLELDAARLHAGLLLDAEMLLWSAVDENPPTHRVDLGAPLSVPADQGSRISRLGQCTRQLRPASSLAGPG